MLVFLTLNYFLNLCRDWIRNNKVSPDDEVFVEKFSKSDATPITRRTPEQRKKDLEAALNWLRKKGTDDDLLDPTGDFRRLDASLPKKRGQSAEDRAEAIESALDWCRTKGVAPSSDEALPTFEKLGSTPFGSRSPGERTKQLRDVLNWLRNKGKDDSALDPTGEFRKMDASIPIKKGQSPEDRARDIEGSL